MSTATRSVATNSPPQHPRWATSTAIVLLAISCLLLATAVSLVLGTDATVSVVAFVPMQLTFAGVGAVVAARRPRNCVGWLFVAFGLLGSVAMLATALSGGIDIIGHGAQGAQPRVVVGATVERWSAWIATVWTELSLLPILLALLLFPTGHVLSRQWRWVAVAVVVVELLGTITTAVSDVNFHNNYAIDDPMALVPPSLMLPVYNAYQLSEVLLLVTVVVGMAMRFRRSDLVTRTQMKWVTYACAVLVVALLVALTVTSQPVWAFIVFLPLIPVAAGTAILRYRLFDIDRLVSRTVSYALVSGCVLLTYAVAIALSTRLLPATSNLAVAAATLAAAAIARPVLRSVQGRVDRRFNRPRFDAVETVERFGVDLRHEIEVERVERELLTAVQDTLQPDCASLWTVRA